jgi:hypothetical protein
MTHLLGTMHRHGWLLLAAGDRDKVSPLPAIGSNSGPTRVQLGSNSGQFRVQLGPSSGPKFSSHSPLPSHPLPLVALDLG